MKQYVGFVRDHSQSMRPLVVNAAKDYNTNLLAFQNAARENGVDTILTVVKCGVGWDAKVVNEVVNSNVYVVEPIAENKYETSGAGTPLFQSVNECINLMRKVPDVNAPDVSFLVMVITDGQENRSVHGSRETMIANIKTLQATDHWTFVFRVPRGDKYILARLGVPEGNILEWDQTTKGFEAATYSTESAVAAFYGTRVRGSTSTNSFYADLHNVTPEMVKTSLVDISGKIGVLNVRMKDDGIAIKELYERDMGIPFSLGICYYELTKPEKVQETKKIIIRNRASLKTYAGHDARSLLGLPNYGEVKLIPANLGDYKVFIQSTSVNRKLVGDTQLVIYQV